MISELGLVLIIIAWIVQFYHVWKNKKEILPSFVMIYALGVLLLVFDGFVY